MPSFSLPTRTIFDDVALRAQVDRMLGELTPGKRGKFVSYVTLDGKWRMQIVHRINGAWVIGASLAGDVSRGIKGGLEGGLTIRGEW